LLVKRDERLGGEKSELKRPCPVMVTRKEENVFMLPFICPHCGGKKARELNTGCFDCTFECRKCHHLFALIPLPLRYILEDEERE
jgi:hypothetical protein